MKLSSEKYFGTVIKKQRIGDYYLSLTKYNSQCKIPLHCHENPYLSVNLGGNYQEQGSHTDQILSIGDAIIRPSAYKHRNIFQNTGLCFNLEILNYSNKEIRPIFNDTKTSVSNFVLYKLITGFINTYSYDELDCLIQEALFFDNKLLFHSKIPTWFKKVKDLINNEYASSLTLKYISAEINIHPNYLARKFKQITGITLGGYIRNTRLEKSYQSIFTGQTNLTSIAIDSGFYDQPHFTKLFTAAFGNNPAKMRSSLKKLI